jgi:hypothetical protein
MLILQVWGGGLGAIGGVRGLLLMFCINYWCPKSAGIHGFFTGVGADCLD